MKTIKMLMMAALTILSVTVFSQDTTKHPAKNPKQKAEKVMYCCPMHSDVTSDKPGKCYKCGMALNLSPKEKMKYEIMKIYTCPMHPDVTSKTPGKCSKCGMALKEKTS